MMQLSLFLLLVTCAIIGSAGPLVGQESEREQSLKMLGTIRNQGVSESSGLAISLNVEDAFWTHNDSGHPAHLFMISTSGKSLAQCELKKCRNIDWEAMSSFKRADQSWLMVADVGDNSRNRTVPSVYLLLEPELAIDSSDAQPSEKKERRHKSGKRIESKAIKLDFEYADGPHNIEAAAVTPDGKNVWFIEKIYSNDSRRISPGIYSMPLNNADFEIESKTTRQRKKAKRIADYPIRNVTGMSFSPDGQRLIVRNYLNAHMFVRDEGQSWEQIVKNMRPEPVALPLQSQGEAICFTADSTSLLITSEFRRSAIWKVTLPQIEK